MKINHIRGAQGSGKTTQLIAIRRRYKNNEGLFFSDSTTAEILEAMTPRYGAEQRRYHVICIDDFNPKKINLAAIARHPAAQGAAFHVAHQAGAA